MFRVFKNGETFNFVPELEENTYVQLPEKGENDADTSHELDLGECIELYCYDHATSRKFVEDKLYNIRRICKFNDIMNLNPLDVFSLLYYCRFPISLCMMTNQRPVRIWDFLATIEHIYHVHIVMRRGTVNSAETSKLFDMLLC